MFCLVYPKSQELEFSKSYDFHLYVFGVGIHDRKILNQSTYRLLFFFFFVRRHLINAICFVKEVVRDGNSSKSHKQQG